MRKPKNLEKYADLPDDTLLDYTQMGRVFDIEQRSVTASIKRGLLPEHDTKKWVTQSAFGVESKRRKKHFWSLGLIRSIEQKQVDGGNS